VVASVPRDGRRTREFFLKGLKKLKFEKGVPVGNNSKNGCPPSVPKNICRPLPRISRPSRGPLRQESRPVRGWEASRPASGMLKRYLFFNIFYFLLEFIIYKLFKIQTIFKYNIYSPYYFVNI
jgi:hypothetical protein